MSVRPVLALKHKVGVHKRIPDQGYRESAECRVINFDAHVVSLELLTTSARMLELLEMVGISRDEDKARPMLIVRGT